MNYEKSVSLKEKSHAELSVTIKKDDVTQEYKKLLNKYSKELQLPGFRKGKVPVSVLEAKYSDAIRSDLMGNMMDETLNEIFTSLNEYERPLRYSTPELKEPPVLDFDKDFSFIVHYDVFPKAEFKKLEGFTITLPEVEVADSDIRKELEELQERNALVTDCKEDAIAEKNNIATVDFCEIDDSGNPLQDTERTDFVFTLGSYNNTYEIDDDVIGMKKDEVKEIKKTYPKNHKNFPDSVKNIKIKLKGLKRKDLPAIDDDLAQDISEKYKTLQDLKDDLKKTLQRNVDEALKKFKADNLLEQIVKENPFELPESMVRAELESNWLMTANRFGTSVNQLEKIFAGVNQTKADIFEKWRTDAEKQLRSRIVIEILTNERKIEADDKKIEEEFNKLAENSGKTVDEMKKLYSENGYMEYFKDKLNEEILMNQLYEKCTVVNGEKLTASDFFKNDASQDTEE